MSAVVHFVEKAVDAVGSAVSNVVDNALKDPIGTIAKVAAVATGQIELLPVISAADVVAHGGNLEDAAKAAAISYVAPQVGAQIGTALEFDTTPFSAQTTQLAAQSADMLSLPASLAAKAASSATASALGGGDIKQGMINTLANYGLRQGIDYTFDAAGNAVNNNGDTLLSPTGELSPAVTTPVSEQAQTDTNIVDNGDGTYTMPNPEGGSVTTDAAGNVISTTTEDGQVIPMRPVEEAVVTPVAEDQTTVQPIAPEATVTPVAEDQTTTESIAPTETPAEVPGFKWDETTQTYVPEDAGTVDTSTSGYTIDPVTGLPVAEEPAADLNYSAVGKYLQNQLTGSFIRSLIGGNVPTYSPTRTTFTNAAGLPTTADKTATTFTTPDVGYNIGTQAQFASILPEDYLKEDKKENMSDAFSADAAEYAKQKFLESQFYDAPPEYAADGGLIGHNPQFFSEGGAGIHHRYVKGDGDGTSDSVPAMLASGEFVIPADVVSSLGNGDNDAGASVLDRFMQEIRSHKRSAKPDQLPPDSKGPLSYLKAAQKKKVKKHGRS